MTDPGETDDPDPGDRDNDPNEVMRAIAKRLSDGDITALAVFLSQTPELHEAAP